MNACQIWFTFEITGKKCTIQFWEKTKDMFFSGAANYSAHAPPRSFINARVEWVHFFLNVFPLSNWLYNIPFESFI